MTGVIFGAVQKRQDVIGLKTKDINYSYPKDLNFKPGSELSNKVLTLVLDYATSSSCHMNTRFPAWQESDKTLTAYKRIDSEEENVLYNDDRKPVSIVYPHSYAILETLLAYMMSAFFQNPIIQYEGFGPNDVIGAILLEKVVSLHSNKFKHILNLHTMFRDAFVYGAGYVVPVWKRTPIFEGNALINLDPYRLLPDPHVAANQLQEGEFFGWVSDHNYVSLLEEELNDPKNLFNVKYLSSLQYQGTSIYQIDNSGRYFKSDTSKYHYLGRQPYTTIEMYIKLIPSDYDLSDSERPEIWYFKVAADAVVLSARKANFDHKLIPACAIVPDFDGYSSSPVSKIEMLSGMQGLLDWMLNSHVANVRKAINDTLIYDPSLINSKDLRNPKPGKLVRMRRSAYGRGKISDAIQQLTVSDITRGNVTDSSWLLSAMQSLSGTDDSSMGILRSGGPERLTKAEFQGTAAGKISRLERTARIIGVQGIQDIGEFFAWHTKQVMKDEQFISIAGDWQDLLLQEYGQSIDRGRMAVSPKDIDVNTDVLVRDGSLPNGNYSEVWLRLFESLGSNPELAQEFDVVRIFKHIARNAGAKNVNEFIARGGDVKAEVQPNEQVQQQVQAGNLIPFNEAV
jgi:hypothetical protein